MFLSSQADKGAKKLLDEARRKTDEELRMQRLRQEGMEARLLKVRWKKRKNFNCRIIFCLSKHALMSRKIAYCLLSAAICSDFSGVILQTNSCHCFWGKCEQCIFSASERSNGEGKGKEEEGKGEREIGSEALAETEKINGWTSAAFAGIPGPIPGWGVCDFFFRFCQSFTSNFSFSFPFLFLSLSLSIRPFACHCFISQLSGSPLRCWAGCQLYLLYIVESGVNSVWKLWSYSPENSDQYLRRCVLKLKWKFERK